MEIFVKEYLNEQGIKTIEGLAQHIIELKRNTVVPKIVFELVDVLVNDKGCLLSFLAENKESGSKKQPVFLKDDFRLIDLWAIEKPLGEDLEHWLDTSYLNQNSNTSKEAHQEWQDRWTKTMTGEVNGKRQEKVKVVLDDMLKDDVIFNNRNAEKETIEFLGGIKETVGKVDYSEINLEILDLMAERFSANKHKYPKGNMKKSIDMKSLEWALFRHIKKMIQPIDGDEEDYKQHLTAILCNASMILDQLKNVK